jgi:CubicO group peptidase (beta-lactamase class C family)
MKTLSLAAYAICLLALTLSGLRAQLPAEQGQVAFPETAAGREASAYFQAFNSQDENVMRLFLERHISRASLEARPVDERMAIYGRLATDLATLTPVKVVKAEEYSLIVIAHSATDKWVQMLFDIEQEPPHGIAGVGIRLLPEPPDLDEPTTPLTEAAMQEELRAYMAGLMEEDGFSGVVLVAKGEKPLFHEAYGMASKEYDVPNLKDTRFNLGSINKFMTHIAIEQLAGKGMLSFDDKIGKYLPDYPNRDAAAKVTIGQLLDMTSGIGDFFGDKFDATPKDRIRDLEDYLPLFAEDSLLFEPGTDSQYSNGGYVVLGLIIEKVSGKTYFDYVRDNIYAVAGMNDTEHLEADVPTANVACGYTRNWGENGEPGAYWRNNIYSRPARGSSAGGGYSTAEDLVRLVGAIRSGKIPAPESWRLAAAQGGALAGGAPGINAFLGTVGNDYVVVVLSNYDPPAAVKVGQRIKNMVGRLS